MAKAKMEFKKGDRTTHYFRIPVDSWSSGGSLFFAAKTQPDNDSTDALAVIDKEFTDANTAVVGDYVEYTLNFLAADTAKADFSDGSKKKVYNGEFEFVPTDGEPVSFPGDSDFIEVTIHADIKRGV